MVYAAGILIYSLDRRFSAVPIYEYQCKKCGEEFEVFQGVADPPVKTCRYCQGPIKRIISRTTFHLKGSGWYVTDYGGKKATSFESKEDSPASSTISEAKKTETAPASAEIGKA
jgi:putative FmdB family regulatory protein